MLREPVTLLSISRIEMPSRDDHLCQVEHNDKVIAALDRVDFGCRDWQATVTFYACVHLVEAGWADDGVHSQTHSERQPRVRRRYKPIARAYQKLEQISRKARYEVIHPNRSQYAKHCEG